MSETALEAGEAAASVSRVLDAPPALVFSLWTDPTHIAKWWMPEGFERVVCESMDVRPGGHFHMRMHHRDGTVYLSRNTYSEVLPPARLVYEEVCEENGQPFHYAQLTVRFDAEDPRTPQRTHLRIHARIRRVSGGDPKWTLDAMKLGWTHGWKDNLGMLGRYVASFSPGAASDERGDEGDRQRGHNSLAGEEK
ncbi:MAG: SRPBCC domain-containing protein [Moraxellaceae bacterium]|nr:SRPBCC domain-containing protein [Moraxellaceae bacterium]